MKSWYAVALMLLPAGCALDEVVTANSEDVVIAEVYLRTDLQLQTAVLHRTRQPFDSTLTVPGARIEVTNDAGGVMRYFATADTVCTAPPRESRPPVGSCYVSSLASSLRIVPGQNYSLRITLADGGELTGTTMVPDSFRVLRPSNHECMLPHNTRFDVVWAKSEGAWVYASEIAIRGLRTVLEPEGLDIPDPLRLFGLSVSSTDTTISFPNEFGLFDRFDPDVTEALVLIQPGLPPNTAADVVIAAADRNYVNWERGGNFNPSGVVRIGNLRGDGAGVFGSLVLQHFHVRINGVNRPPC